MMDFERIHAVKAAAQARLLVLPGVHAVGVGPKLVAGQPTGELAVKVYLVQKKPPSELTADEAIPPEIDGVKTDVVEMAVPRLQEADADRERPLLLGTRVWTKHAKEGGTLGFLARTNDNPPKLVFVTCQHVVAPPSGTKMSNLSAHTFTLTPTSFQIGFGGSNSPGSLVVVKMEIPSQLPPQKPNPILSQKWCAFWTTTSADTLESIANSVVNAINGAGAAMTAAIGPQPDVVIVTQNPGASTVVDCTVFDPIVADPECPLVASVAGNMITLSGKAEGEYGVYTSWSTDGNEESHGGFTRVVPDSTLIDVAKDIAKTINELKGRNGLSIPNITATPNGATVTVNGAKRVLCQITRDLRVGQPTDGFSSNCSLCCTDEIGRVLTARTELDVALVQLRRGLEYMDEVKGDPSIPVGHTLITGVHTVTPAEVAQPGGYPVNKRGAMTLYTFGTVDALDVSGYTTNSPSPSAPGPHWTVFYRFYDHAMSVVSSGSTSPNPFSDAGDSGAAVFNSNGQIVGMVFSGSGTRSMVTPIEQITSLLGVTVVAAAALGVKQTVSDAEGALAMVRVDADELMTRRVLEAQGEIAATPGGRELAEVVRRHTEEVQTLVNTNRRVGTAWRRYGGPELVGAVFSYVQEPTRRPSETASGLSLTERLRNIQRALLKYGSAALSADLQRYGPRILALTDLSYAEMLTRLQGETG